ncbi:MAG: proline--tRNA ligase [Candidatus Freyarchaeota archaeon]
MAENTEAPLPDKEKNFSEWYNEIVQRAELVDLRYGVKGFVVYRPNVANILRQTYRLFEDALDAHGHSVCNFPVVIPLEFFQKEAEHIKGFSGEVFWITRAGDTELERPLVLRPTSETAMYPLYAYWVRSYRDLPLKLYQSNTVYRYETKATKPLIRGREFYWIEAHDVHRTVEDAVNQVREDMEITIDVLHNQLGIPFMLMERPPWDRFAGADRSYAFDVLFPDKNVLQIATTHLLGENFSRAFEIMFEDEDGTKKYCQQTCFGIGISRIAATIISMHGDNYGLVLPFHVAPLQIVIVPIPKKGKNELVMEKCEEVYQKLKDKGYRVKLDDSEDRPGAKFYHWELLGVPIRLEIGPRDIENGVITVFRRDKRERFQVKENQLEETIEQLKNDILNELRTRREKDLRENIREAKSREEFLEIAKNKGGFIRIEFCDREECSEVIKEETGGYEVRGKRFGVEEKPKGNCVICGEKAKSIVYVAKAY